MTVQGSEGFGRRQKSLQEDGKNWSFIVRPAAYNNVSLLKPPKDSVNQNSNLMLKQSIQSSKRQWNTVTVDPDCSEGSGNVTSESELDMNATVPAQVQQEMLQTKDN